MPQPLVSGEDFVQTPTRIVPGTLGSAPSIDPDKTASVTDFAIHFSGPILTFKKVTLSHAGEYRCSVLVKPTDARSGSSFPSSTLSNIGTLSRSFRLQVQRTFIVLLSIVLPIFPVHACAENGIIFPHKLHFRRSITTERKSRGRKTTFWRGWRLELSMRSRAQQPDRCFLHGCCCQLVNKPWERERERVMRWLEEVLGVPGVWERKEGEGYGWKSHRWVMQACQTGYIKCFLPINTHTHTPTQRERERKWTKIREIERAWNLRLAQNPDAIARVWIGGLARQRDFPLLINSDCLNPVLPLSSWTVWEREKEFFSFGKENRIVREINHIHQFS